MLYALDWETGDVHWARELHASAPAAPRHLKNSYASETPVTDGDRVYAYFGQLGVFAFDMDGAPLWSRRWGPFQTRNGWARRPAPASCSFAWFVWTLIAQASGELETTIIASTRAPNS